MSPEERFKAIRDQARAATRPLTDNCGVNRLKVACADAASDVWAGALAQVEAERDALRAEVKALRATERGFLAAADGWLDTLVDAWHDWDASAGGPTVPLNVWLGFTEDECGRWAADSGALFGILADRGQCRSLEDGTPLRCEFVAGHDGAHSFVASGASSDGGET